LITVIAFARRSFLLFPLPPRGERVRVRGEKMTFYGFINLEPITLNLATEAQNQRKTEYR